MLKGYITYKGWLWPRKDRHARKAIIDRKSYEDISRAMPHVTGTRSVVQAGGNCGVWASKLSPLFANVYTFEPDPVNFTALAVNTAPFHNVHRFQCALSDVREHLLMGRDRADNVGAYRIGGTTPTSDGIAAIRLDDLGLAELDLLLLDIEGYEVRALRGARNTIVQCLPVIMIEDKGLDAKHHGIERGAAVAFLEGLGYEVKERVARDVILVPGEKLAVRKLFVPDGRYEIAESNALTGEMYPIGTVATMEDVERYLAAFPHHNFGWRKLEDEWVCPINYPGCKENCGNYGCGN